ncbi:hypothetical protein GCM10009077_27500 [Roseibium denhamense]
MRPPGIGIRRPGWLDGCSDRLVRPRPETIALAFPVPFRVQGLAVSDRLARGSPIRRCSAVI